MNEKNTFLQELLDMISDNLSPKANMVSELAGILSLEKASVYRRVRGEVSFSFAEIATLARTLKFSIDPFIQTFSPEEHPFLLPLINFIHPSEIDYKLMELHNEQFLMMENSEKPPETSETCNFLPAVFHHKYERLTRFYIFKWLYKYRTPRETTPYRKIEIDSRLRELQYQHYYTNRRIIKHSHYIIDHLIFYYIVNDLKYFSGIELITPEEISNIKAELNLVIDEMEQASLTGTLPGTEHDCKIYISSLNLDTNYLYMLSDNFQLAAIKVFMHSYAASLERETVSQFKKWIESFKKHSVLISGCNELYQRTFFSKQRKIIAQL